MWDWAIWAALVVAVLAGIAALGLLATRARSAWRDVKDARRGAVRRLDELAVKAEATTEKIAATGQSAELQESLRHLRVSLAELAALRSAIEESRDAVGRVASYLPRK